MIIFDRKKISNYYRDLVVLVSDLGRVLDSTYPIRNKGKGMIASLLECHLTIRHICFMLNNKSVNHFNQQLHVRPAASSPHSPSTKTHQPSSPWPP
jgi:hypothetical protein